MAEDFKVAVLISGRGSNMEALLNAASRDPEIGYEIDCVVSDNPDAPGLAIARAHRVESFFLEPGETFRTRLTDEAEAQWAEFLKQRGVRYIALAGFMRILKGPLLAAFPGAILNIHPSLLPKFPGLDIHARVLAAGERESGCTVHLVDAGTDTGPILGQSVVPVLEGDNPEKLAHRVLHQEHILYPLVLSRFVKGSLKAGDAPLVLGR